MPLFSEVEVGVLIKFRNQLLGNNSLDKRKIVQAMFSYVKQKELSSTDYSMLNKLITDFGYEILYNALVSVRYSELRFTDSYWPYIIAVCKNILLDTEYNVDELLATRTQDLLKELQTTTQIDAEKRKSILEDMYE